MTRTLIVALGTSLVVTACAAPPPPSAEAPPASPPVLSAGWTASDGMDAPESAYLDEAAGAIYVSVVGGAADAKDGNGRIARLGLDGTVVSRTWVTGLNAPKGLRLCQGTLWVSDIDQVVGISPMLGQGQVSSRVPVAGAKFLNDVACGPDGTVYVSDMLASRIYALKDGVVSTFAEGEALEYPNGLLVEGGRLIVAAWGKPEADFSTKVPGRLYALDLASKAKTLITQKPLGNLDGLESDGNGGFIVSDWNAGQIWHVTPTGEAHAVRKFAAGTADLAYQASRQILILPHMSENKVSTYDLSGAAR